MCNLDRSGFGTKQLNVRFFAALLFTSLVMAAAIWFEPPVSNAASTVQTPQDQQSTAGERARPLTKVERLRQLIQEMERQRGRGDPGTSRAESPDRTGVEFNSSSTAGAVITEAAQDAATAVDSLVTAAAVGCKSINFNAPPNYPFHGFSVNRVAVGDFNRDGKTDIAAALLAADSVSVMLGDGKGRISSTTNFQLIFDEGGSDPAPSGIATADFNGDLKLDLVTANVGNPGTVSLLLGDGTGRFGTNTDFPAGARPFTILAFDFNRDSKIDVVTASRFSNNVSVLLGDGMGGLGAPTTFPAGTGLSDLWTGDFNNDGKRDLVVTNVLTSGDGTVSILLGDGMGRFGAPVSFPAGKNPSSVVADDFNRDGKRDLVVANQTSPGAVSILLGDGTGRFGTPVSFPAGDAPLKVGTGDFNNDGNRDIAVANNPFVTVLLGDGTGKFGSPVSFPSGGSNSVVVADLNGDGKRDLLASASGVTILLGNGTGDFPSPNSFPVGGDPSEVWSSDLNSDGKPDLVTSNPGSDEISILLGDGKGSFGNPTRFPVSGGPNSVVVDEFNSDGKPDIVTTNFNTNDVALLLGDGKGNFGAPLRFAMEFEPISVATGDFNRDGKRDIVTANVGAFSVSILLGNGKGSFSTATNITLSDRPNRVLVDDFNRDGKRDIVVATEESSTFTNNVLVLLGDGMGNFAAPVSIDTGGFIAGIATADFNRDGNRDIVTANLGNPGFVTILLGNGTGQFSSPKSFPLDTAPDWVATGDFNGDSITDLVIANSFDPVSFLLGDGTGNFINAVPNFVVDLSGEYAVFVTDFNGDAKPDVVTANFSSHNVTALLNLSTCSPVVSPSSLTLSPSTVVGSRNSTGTVTLNAPAPAGGTVVSLFETNSAVTIPSSVTVPAGATSANFTITTRAVATTRTVPISAKVFGVSRSATLTVRPIGVGSLSLSPNPVVGPNTSTGTVTLEARAAPSNIVVSLTSSNPSVARIANSSGTTISSISIAAGSTTGTFFVRTANVSTTSTAVITATANGVSKQITLTVQ